MNNKKEVHATKRTIAILDSILNALAYQPDLDPKRIIKGYYYGEKERLERLNNKDKEVLTYKNHQEEPSHG